MSTGMSPSMGPGKLNTDHSGIDHAYVERARALAARVNTMVFQLRTVGALGMNSDLVMSAAILVAADMLTVSTNGE